MKHGHCAKNKHTPEYGAWRAAKSRCTRTTDPQFIHYGARGIRMCDAWTVSFEAFLADMGDRPSKNHSLDRIDPNGGYEPGNCRWATALEQAHSKRLSASRVAAVLDAHDAEYPELIAKLRAELLGT